VLLLLLLSSPSDWLLVCCFLHDHVRSLAVANAAATTTVRATTKAATAAKPTTARATTAKPTTARATTARATTAKATTANATTAKATTVKATTTAARTTKAATTKAPTTARATTAARTNAQTCCSSNSNNGGLFSFGLATADLSSGTGAKSYQAWMVTDGLDTLSVLFYPKSQNLDNFPGSYSMIAQAGYIIHAEPNGSQHLTSWFTDSSSNVVCKNQTIPSPVKVLPGFNSCPGVAGSLFGNSSTPYKFPNSAHPNPLNFLAYTVEETATQLANFEASFLKTGDGVCELTAFVSNSPINSHEFSFIPIYAAPAPEPSVRQANFFTPPSACN
jgi:hypothetical protein